MHFFKYEITEEYNVFYAEMTFTILFTRSALKCENQVYISRFAIQFSLKHKTTLQFVETLLLKVSGQMDLWDLLNVSCMNSDKG